LIIHNFSLLPIEWLSESFGLAFFFWQQNLIAEKLGNYSKYFLIIIYYNFNVIFNPLFNN
ncbi:hypothetical protein BCR32DRAFT_202822, partial [Anaeromyces robustus]